MHKKPLLIVATFTLAIALSACSKPMVYMNDDYNNQTTYQEGYEPNYSATVANDDLQTEQTAPVTTRHHWRKNHHYVRTERETVNNRNETEKTITKRHCNYKRHHTSMNDGTVTTERSVRTETVRH